MEVPTWCAEIIALNLYMSYLVFCYITPIIMVIISMIVSSLGLSCLMVDNFELCGNLSGAIIMVSVGTTTTLVIGVVYIVNWCFHRSTSVNVETGYVRI